MKIHMLVAGAAVLALAVGSASAADKNAGGKYAAPSQPIAYSKLDAYLKATPTQRAKRDWSSGAAATTATGVNTSATTPAVAALPSDTSNQPGGAVPPLDTGAQPGAQMQPPGDQAPPPNSNNGMNPNGANAPTPGGTTTPLP